jgi:predicted nucleic acid-binding protein
MSTKLTLLLDDRLIKNAKKTARSKGVSLSRMVADYFRSIESQQKKQKVESPGFVRNIRYSFDEDGYQETALGLQETDSGEIPLKTVLCDIHFILDIFLKREPFYTPAARIFQEIEEKELEGYLYALSFPTLFYLLSKEQKRDKAMKVLEKVRIVFNVAAVDEKVIDLSLVSGFKDFEDAVQYYSAFQVKADCIITRNKGDYRDDKLPVLAPDEFLATLATVIVEEKGGTQ